MRTTPGSRDQWEKQVAPSFSANAVDPDADLFPKLMAYLEARINNYNKEVADRKDWVGERARLGIKAFDVLKAHQALPALDLAKLTSDLESVRVIARADIAGKLSSYHLYPALSEKGDAVSQARNTLEAVRSRSDGESGWPETELFTVCFEDDMDFPGRVP